MGDVQGELDTVCELEGKWRALVCHAMIHTEEHRLELDVLQDAALATINTVVVTHGVRHGAAALLRSGLDLNKVEPGFLPKSL